MVRRRRGGLGKLREGAAGLVGESVLVLRPWHAPVPGAHTS